MTGAAVVLLSSRMESGSGYLGRLHVRGGTTGAPWRPSCRPSTLACAPLPHRTTSGSRLDWATGDEPMTGAQASYLETFRREAGEEAPPADLTKAQASERIDALQQQTGRGA